MQVDVGVRYDGWILIFKRSIVKISIIMILVFILAQLLLRWIK